MRYRAVMVDILALLLSHGLLALAAWRLILRDDLDADPPISDAATPEPSADPAPAPLSRAAGRRAARSRN